MPVVELALSVGPNWLTATAAINPRTIPSRPPAMPVTSDSPATWRTTIRCVHPSAFSVPSSRTRLPTDESASSAARRNAAAAATIARTTPRLCERFDASTSEPLIWSATCFELATWASGSAVWIAFCTLPTAALSVARTSTTFARPCWPASVCSCFSGR